MLKTQTTQKPSNAGEEKFVTLLSYPMPSHVYVGLADVDIPAQKKPLIQQDGSGYVDFNESTRIQWNTTTRILPSDWEELKKLKGDIPGCIKITPAQFAAIQKNFARTAEKLEYREQEEDCGWAGFAREKIAKKSYIPYSCQLRIRRRWEPVDINTCRYTLMATIDDERCLYGEVLTGKDAGAFLQHIVPLDQIVPANSQQGDPGKYRLLSAHIKKEELAAPSCGNVLFYVQGLEIYFFGLYVFQDLPEKNIAGWDYSDNPWRQLRKIPRVFKKDGPLLGNSEIEAALRVVVDIGSIVVFHFLYRDKLESLVKTSQLLALPVAGNLAEDGTVLFLPPTLVKQELEKPNNPQHLEIKNPNIRCYKGVQAFADELIKKLNESTHTEDNWSSNENEFLMEPEPASLDDYKHRLKALKLITDEDVDTDLSIIKVSITNAYERLVLKLFPVSPTEIRENKVDSSSTLRERNPTHISSAPPNSTLFPAAPTTAPRQSPVAKSKEEQTDKRGCCRRIRSWLGY